MSPIIDTYDVSEDALNLKYMLDTVLERVVATFTSYNVPLPERQYWTMGVPAIDCDQLVVSFIQMYLGTPGDEANVPQRCNVPRSAVLSISLARAIPVQGLNGRAPSADKLQEAAAISAVDAYTLMESINQFDTWEDGGSYGMGVIATCEAPTAEGGFQVISMQITMVIP
jgi:hypothetical protein